MHVIMRDCRRARHGRSASIRNTSHTTKTAAKTEGWMLPALRALHHLPPSDPSDVFPSISNYACMRSPVPTTRP